LFITKVLVEVYPQSFYFRELNIDFDFILIKHVSDLSCACTSHKSPGQKTSSKSLWKYSVQ